MDINWLTVVAQLVNFLVLVYLLKRFLYHPVITAMEEREKLIASKLESAREREAAASARQQDFQNKQDALEQEKQSILEDAKNQAQQEYETQTDAARKQISEQQARWLEQLGKEQQDYLDELARQGGEALVRIAAQILDELSDSQLQDRIVDVFISKLRTLSAEQGSSLGSADGPLTVSTAFELEEAQRLRLQNALEPFCKDKELSFQLEPELIGGIELSVDGEKISWNIRDYLEQLNQQMQTALSQTSRDKR